MRQRYIKRRKERQVRWLSGTISQTGEPEMGQRISVRSSWGTPIERPISDGTRWLTPFSSDDQNHIDTDHDITPGLPITTSDAMAPVLPMPAISPVRSRSPEDPFADIPAPPRPLKSLASLPIRISLISTGSETQSQDPFDDSNARTPPADGASQEFKHISAATFGHGKGFHLVNNSQANFPMPPSTAASTQTTFVVGNPNEHLQTPTMPTFPDSPVSPSFASFNGPTSFPRRASVKYGFQPSQERRDEVHLEKGDAVSIVSVYEDGWAFIQREKNSERGLVPLNCLDIGTAI